MLKGLAPIRRVHGFTLIELLVVVAIIALLVTLVFPSMRAARDHARCVRCQTNLATVGKALIGYALERDSFPITSDRSGKECSWRYGGWTGAGTIGPNWTWKSYRGGVYFIPTGERPLTRHMHRGDLEESERVPVFRCPSDNRSQRALLPPAVRPSGLSAYEDIGTSYHLNWQWFELQTTLPDRTQSTDPERVERGGRIWWKYFERNSARFITLMEDPADFGFRNARQMEGNHGQFSKHNFAFLDGHAEYIMADTRSLLQRGRWTTIDETPPYKDWLPK